MQVVWLKRDLRIADHEPLAQAAARGPTLVLYAFEPDVLDHPDTDPSHTQFILESLAELKEALKARGADLTVRRGSMPGILDALHDAVRIDALWSHEESGNNATWERDKRVAAWCRDRGIPWVECTQFGVVRRLRDRDGWAKGWQQRMARPLIPAPGRIEPVALDPGELPALTDLGPPSERTEAQTGGESQALATLDSFLTERGVNYRADMSSPVTGWQGCSRLSAYLAYGNVSMKRVHQATVRRQRQVKARKDIDPRWRASLTSFSGRLRWHGHFIQKFEDETSLEHTNMNRAYDGLREHEFDEERFVAYVLAETGYPMVDACLRCLKATGWMNFRMRAMLVSFASYHLWLHWPRPANHLARLFLDFEPGIHYPQVQMQSGVTGINSIRIYSPVKQVTDQDPDGVFIKRWLPELEGVPLEHLAEPHKMPPLLQQAVGVRIGVDYPEPIVPHGPAYQSARRRMHRWKARPEAKAEAQRVYRKHGSRRQARNRPWARRPR